MTSAAEPNHSGTEQSDTSGYPDRESVLSQEQVTLMNEVASDPDAPELNLQVVDNKNTSVYEAVVDHRDVAGLAYSVADNSRLILLSVSVAPDFRRRGIGTELIRRVLDDVRVQGKTVTIVCPIVLTFIENNPIYADLIDPEHPGRHSRSWHTS